MSSSALDGWGGEHAAEWSRSGYDRADGLQTCNSGLNDCLGMGNRYRGSRSSSHVTDDSRTLVVSPWAVDRFASLRAIVAGAIAGPG